jgi:16S rRNA (cytosine967-C5)-methyltransferase
LREGTTISLKNKNAREMAREALHAVLEEGAYSNLALNKVLEKYQPEKIDRGFITELVYGTLRTLNTLDWVLSGFLKQPLSKLPARIKTILRMGAYQVIYMAKVPDSAACNESANLARIHGHAGTVKLVNGVLRNLVRNKEQLAYPDIEQDPVQAIAVRYSHPEWLVARWIEEYGVTDAEKLCRANNEIPPNAVRTNTLKTSRAELQKTLAGEGIEAREGRLAPETLVIDGFKSVGAMAAHRTGLFMVQDESSTLVGHALNPLPGGLVIDACSAPGGKSTHIAQLMKNTGRIISCDIHPHKIKLIEENASRLGINIIEPVVLDAAVLDRDLKEQADYILVDAPCSGLGVLRRRPEIRWRKKPEEISELPKLQLKILLSAGKCLKAGGVLVYSTCTITHEENLDVVNEFLQQCGDFQLESLAGHLPESLSQMPGTETMTNGYIQFFPHIHGTDGFFIARLRKSG